MLAKECSFLGHQRGEVLCAWNVGLAKSIAIPTKTTPYLKQQSRMQEKQKAINS